MVLPSRDDGRGHYADRWVTNIGGKVAEPNAQSWVLNHLPSVPSAQPNDYKFAIRCWRVKGRGDDMRRKGSEWGRLYIHDLKANHRNLKCFECRGPSSEQEGTALFYLEFGSLAWPGEAGVAFSGGMQRNSSYLASFLSASNRNSTQQWLCWTTDDTTKHSDPGSLSGDKDPGGIDKR